MRGRSLPRARFVRARAQRPQRFFFCEESQENTPQWAVGFFYHQLMLQLRQLTQWQSRLVPVPCDRRIPSSILITGGATRRGGAWVGPSLNFEMPWSLDLAEQLSNNDNTTLTTPHPCRVRPIKKGSSLAGAPRRLSTMCGSDPSHVVISVGLVLVFWLCPPLLSRRHWPRHPAADAAELAGNSFTNAETAPGSEAVQHILAVACPRAAPLHTTRTLSGGD